MGYRTWTTGDTVSAADFSSYIANQCVFVFTNTTARDAAITSPSTGMLAYTSADDKLYYYSSGAAWVEASLTGDITAVNTAANSSLAGGSTSGSISLTADVNNSTSATATDADYVLISDTDDSNATKKALISDITALVPQGDLTGLTAGTNIDITSATGPVPTIDLAIDAAVEFGSDGSGVDVTMHSDSAGDYALWDSSEEKLILEGTNGATVLDVTDGNVSIGDGTLAVSGAVTVGSDGSGADVTFHSATASDNFLWDASDEKLVITGTNGQNALEVADGDVSITDALTVTGTTTTYLNVLTDSGTTRTPSLTDAGAYILTTHGTGITVTLPQDTNVAFPVGTTIYFERNGAGTLTFAAGTGATVNSKDATLTCGDRYTTVASVKIAADTWTLIGNIG